ncbi:FkbM family methyltransferase [Rhizobium laguerreae]|nr:FkbM family methyltransferase [Rhizobium laguerreae]
MPLYQAFPDAYHVLIEPLSEFRPYVDEILTKYRGCWVQAASSSTAGKRTLYVEDQYREMSSFFKRADVPEGLREVQVDVVRVGDLVREREFCGPFVLKTDAEGSDLEVLEGAREILPETSLVICECRADGLFGGANIDSIVSFLFGCGFGISNLIEVRWEADGSLRWANVMFRNKGFN